MGELFARLGCLDQMQAELNIKLSTTLSHLYKYQTEVAQLPATDAFIRKSSLAPDQQERVMAAMKIHGTDRLRPLFEELRGEINYNELHLLRLHYLNQR